MQKPLSIEEFKERAIKVHSNFYDYSLVKYKTTNDKVDIICPLHGLYSQIAHAHLRGHRCRKCSSHKWTKTTGDFLERAKKVHGDLYNYEGTKYMHSQSKLKVKCHIHGEFEVLPYLHLKGVGCPKCYYNSGSSNKECYCFKNTSTCFYILYFPEYNFIKIGLTSRSIKKRFGTKKLMPLKYDILFERQGNCPRIWELENKLKELGKDYKFSPPVDFEGRTECYKPNFLKIIKQNL